MPLVTAGGPANINLDVRNGTGDFTDPTNLSLTVKNSLGTAQSGFPIAYPGSIVKDAVGRYHYQWAVPAGQTLGPYTALWEAILLGAPTSAQETWEVVAAGSLSVGGLDFLLKPDDYDAIRGLLGVTTLDVEDTDIEFPAFAPQAEMLVKRRISNWSTQSLITDQLFVLRLAAIYQTACLMAESFVRGGTIGLVRPLSVGEGRDWASAAQLFCSRYEYWVNIADDSDVTDDNAMFDIHPMRVSGPTRRRLAHRQARRVLGNVPLPWWAEEFPPFWPRP